MRRKNTLPTAQTIYGAPERLVTPREAAERLATSVKRVRALVQIGQLVGHTGLGSKSLRVLTSSVDQFIERHKR